MKRTNDILKAAGILILGLFLGYLLFGGKKESKESQVHQQHSEGLQEESWTCSMHPSVRQNQPGDCPICGMDLILISANTLEDQDTFVMSETAMKLANVETLVVGKNQASKEIRLSGKVEVDERNTFMQSSHIPGRIEQLHVNFTGEEVKQGQVLASLYSPELITAQEELIQAAEIRENQPQLFDAAKQKLRNWKISEAQINRMLGDDTTLERFPITADVGGVVTELLAEQGDYLERGMPIYQIANLDKLWVLFDIYESDISWIKPGNTVRFTIQSLPGETFEGEIDFIDPLLNGHTRVATARVEIDNPNNRLKPGMFATGILENNLPGNKKEILIPKSAILWTGKRSLVYLKEKLPGGTGFTIREVVLGASLGESYVVKEGLKGGEEIVVNGTFTVDAAVQLAGKSSMMNPREKEGSREKIIITQQEKTELEHIFSSYFGLKNALVKDDIELATSELKNIENVLAELKTKVFENSGGAMIGKNIHRLQMNLSNLKAAENISALRAGFVQYSEQIIKMAQQLKPFSQQVYIQHCPMANMDKGADWLSLSQEIRNPYYGSAMLGCGEITGVIGNR